MSNKKDALVVVESPNKAKKIQKILGSNYKVLSTMGHCIDLPHSKLGIDIKNDFEPQYEIMKGRKETIDDIIDWSKKSNIVYLATDPDREGEAIALLVANKLPKGTKYKRVVFNEITSKVIKDAIANPIDIDEDLCDAQKARRILDRLVGFKVSPLLWGYVAKKASAGRVQSVGLKLIVDRQQEIDDFIPEEYWEVSEDLKTTRGDDFIAQLKLKDKFEFGCQKDVDVISEYLTQQKQVVSKVRDEQVNQRAYPVFITSTLQRAASTYLGFSSKKTMSVAQKLFELGHITYHRTDSTRISGEALTMARDHIDNIYGCNYLPSKPNFFQVKKNAQDAHEGIRPTDLCITSQQVSSSESQDAGKLYDLIFKRFVSCQMADALIDKKGIQIKAGKRTLLANGQKITFDGWLKLWGQYADFKDINLPIINDKEDITLVKVNTEQKFTSPPSKYTESSLIKELENKGVGRPSTYASIIDTVVTKEYVIKEGKSFSPTSIGKEISCFLSNRFQDLMSIEFTATMESKLDDVSNGSLAWVDNVSEYWEALSEDIKSAKNFIEEAKRTDFKCPKCSGVLIRRISPYAQDGVNKFFACEHWSKDTDKDGACDYTMNAKLNSEGDVVPLSEEENEVVLAKKAQEKADRVYFEENGERVLCPKCNKGSIIQRKRKYDGGLFWACDGFPKCKTIVDDDLNIVESKKKKWKKKYTKK